MIDEHTTDDAMQNDPRAVTSPAQAAGLCEELKKTVSLLTGVLLQETSLLKARRAGDIVKLQPEKTELARSFLRQFTLFKDNAPFIGARAPVAASDLRRSLGVLDGHIKENLNVLEATQAVSQGLVEAVFEIAKKDNAGPTCYSRDAALPQARPHRPTAIAVDRRL